MCVRVVSSSAIRGLPELRVVRRRAGGYRRPRTSPALQVHNLQDVITECAATVGPSSPPPPSCPEPPHRPNGLRGGPRCGRCRSARPGSAGRNKYAPIPACRRNRAGHTSDHTLSFARTSLQHHTETLDAQSIPPVAAECLQSSLRPRRLAVHPGCLQRAASCSLQQAARLQAEHCGFRPSAGRWLCGAPVARPAARAERAGRSRPSTQDAQAPFTGHRVLAAPCSCRCRGRVGQAGPTASATRGSMGTQGGRDGGHHRPHMPAMPPGLVDGCVGHSTWARC